MYTVSQVKGIDKDGTVRMGCLTSACENCKASMFCNNRNDSEFSALNPKGISVKEGDMVELFMPPGKTILSTVLVFALPLALFPLGYLLMKKISPSSGEILCALGGFSAMAVAFGIAAAISVARKRNLMPVITKVVSEN